MGEALYGTRTLAAMKEAALADTSDHRQLVLSHWDRHQSLEMEVFDAMNYDINYILLCKSCVLP